jgi:hypothetical protein
VDRFNNRRYDNNSKVGRVADPDTDPDPACFLIADPDSGSGSRL